MYILIVITLGYGIHVEMQEFNTYKTCADAANFIMEATKTNRLSNVEKAQCVKK